jgi:hypothetical protein
MSLSLRLAALSIVLFSLSGCVGQMVADLFPTPTPVPLYELDPQLALDPVRGYAGSFIQVTGTGWQPGAIVSLVLVEASERSPVLVTSAVDQGGRFAAGFLYPLNERWLRPGSYTILAVTEDGLQQREARFTVEFPGADTPTPTETPFVTATPLPTFTPSRTPQPPTATPQPTPSAASTPTVRPTVTATITLTSTRALATAALTSIPTETLATRPTATAVITIPVISGTGTTGFPDWQGSYWNNPDLAGLPVLIRNDQAIDFDWGVGSPATIGVQLPADNFSARWLRTLDFAPGRYRFFLEVDDGARLFIDEQLVLNAWQSGARRQVSMEHELAGGPHRLRVDYFERTGPARVRLWWEPVAEASGWQGSYFANAELEGTPMLVRTDRVIDFTWDDARLTDQITTTTFGVRWEQSVSFGAGRYRFELTVADGARVWINDNLVIEEWRVGPTRTYTTEIYLTARTYDLRVDYFNTGPDARIRLVWARVDDGLVED